MPNYQSGGTDLFLVLSGHVRIVITAAGRDVILRDIRDRKFFSELGEMRGWAYRPLRSSPTQRDRQQAPITRLNRSGTHAPA